MIPRKAHFYWGAEHISYLRYMTIVSFKKHNPDWEVILYKPKIVSENFDWVTHEHKFAFTSNDYTEQLYALDWLVIKEINFEDFGVLNDMSEVHKSDFFRLHLLSTEGGLWSDMDILYFKPVDTVLDLNDYHDTYFCFNTFSDKVIKYHSIGFLLASENNKIFKLLYEKSFSHITNNYGYQKIGSPFYEKYVKMSNPTICNLPMSIVYPFVRPFSDIWTLPSLVSNQKLKSNTIGIHWYAGAEETNFYQNNITELNYKDYDNIISYTLDRIKG